MAEGVTLRITHSGATNDSILIDDVPHSPGGRNPFGTVPGAVYVPVGGSVDLVYTTHVANSLESGTLRRFLDNGLFSPEEFVFGTTFEAAILAIVGGGLDWKQSVRTASTGNIDLSNLPANIDGVPMNPNDSFLAKNQTAGAENGIWVWSSAGGAATRRGDFDEDDEVTSQAAVRVEEGTLNEDVCFALVTYNPIVVGTDPQVWEVAGGEAGDGLTKTVNTFNVVANADGSIVANADDIQVGVLATDGQHGNRGGGALHTAAVPAGAAGFMTGADKTNLDANTIHRTSNGSDHGFIDQDVTSGSAPTFTGTNFTGIPGSGVDAATTTARGTIEIATPAEVDTGTDNTRAISPLALAGSTLQSDVGLNNTHRTSNGSDHGYIDQDVTNGAAPVLAVTNMTGSAAGIDSDATAHASSNGSSHGYIDQDVTNGAAPVLAVTNMTGSAAGIDSDATAHASSNGSSHGYIDQDVTNGAAPVLAVTNMTGSAAGIDSDATAHASSNGSSHGYIDQDVTSGSTPTFTGTNFTGIPGSGVDQATQTARGTLEVATVAEINTGTDDTRAITPLGLAGSTLQSDVTELATEDADDTLQAKRVARAVWDHGVGLTVAGSPYTFGPTLPDNAVVTRAWYHVSTPFTSGTSTADIGLGIVSDDSGGILAPAVITVVGTAGNHEGIQDGTVANFATQTTAARLFEGTVATEDTTGGKLILFAEYVVTE